MDPTLQLALISAGAALLGALVGGSASVAVAAVQARAERRREMVRLAVEAAVQEFRAVAEHGRDFEVWPLATYLYVHMETLKLMDRGQLTAESYGAVLEHVGTFASVLVDTATPGRRSGSAPGSTAGQQGGAASPATAHGRPRTAQQKFAPSATHPANSAS